MRRDSRIIKINSNNTSGSGSSVTRIDDIDTKVIEFLTFGFNNKQISNKLKVPLSTIQRRTRLILQSGLLEHNFKPDYRRLGLKKE
jgi:hypothetical protein